MKTFRFSYHFNLAFQIFNQLNETILRRILLSFESVYALDWNCMQIKEWQNEIGGWSSPPSQ